MSARKRRDQSIAGRGGSRGWRDGLWPRAARGKAGAAMRGFCRLPLLKLAGWGAELGLQLNQGSALHMVYAGGASMASWWPQEKHPMGIPLPQGEQRKVSQEKCLTLNLKLFGI